MARGRHCSTAVVQLTPPTMSVAHRPNLRVVPKEATSELPPRADRPEANRSDDHGLARALIDGEPWAPAEAWNQFAPMVFRLMKRMLGPDEEVQDLTQDVFMRVFAKVRGLRHPDALRSFVFSVAVRTLKSDLRRRRVRRMFALSQFDQVSEPTVDAVDAEARQALRQFYGILERLSAVERAAFVLRHVEGMKLEEIGEALGVSLATVKRRLERAGHVVSRHVERDPALSAYRVRARGADEGH
jgi:RNA polymerase sigma-70 factor (ECF subfamily)